MTGLDVDNDWLLDPSSTPTGDPGLLPLSCQRRINFVFLKKSPLLEFPQQAVQSGAGKP
jgi:hypothetical protein